MYVCMHVCMYVYKDLAVIVGTEHECTTFGSQTIEDEIGSEDLGAVFWAGAGLHYLHWKFEQWIQERLGLRQPWIFEHEESLRMKDLGGIRLVDVAMVASELASVEEKSGGGWFWLSEICLFFSSSPDLHQNLYYVSWIWNVAFFFLEVVNWSNFFLLN